MGTVENSVIFKASYIGNGCTIRNSIILNDVYIGDNTTIENCSVESHSTLQGGRTLRGEDRLKIVVEQGDRYVM